MDVSFWRCGEYRLSLASPSVMGIVNVTPDSFSDGGLHGSAADAVAHGAALVAQGASIVDVGGESTRPGASPVTPAEEIARVLPVIERLSSGLDVPVSIDTRHAEVARACLVAGASIINDVTGFSSDEMVEVAAGSSAGVVVMHMRGEPSTMQQEPRYDDVVGEVHAFLLERAEVLERAGVARERICIDPGIGFGKTLEHNLTLLRAMPILASSGYPVCAGVSRKRFIGEVTGVAEPSERLGGSIAAALWSALHGAAVVRVHDVAETVQALHVMLAIEQGVQG